MDHNHVWERVGAGTHFVDEPNSRRRSRGVYKLQCTDPACGARGYRYQGRPVVYTWSPNSANWLDAASNWGQDEAVTESLRATQTRQR